MTVYNVSSLDTMALVEDMNSLRTSEANAWALAVELRRVLEMVEFDGYGLCLWCNGYGFHKSDCPRQLVLYPPPPTEPGG